MPKSRSTHARRHQKPPRIRRLTPPGSPPATLKVASNATKPIATIVKFNEHQYHEEVRETLAGLNHEVEPGSVTWVQVKGYGDVEAIEKLGASFGLHGLAMEDAVNTHQRSKVEVYDDHLFVVLRMVTVNEHIESEQLGLFLGKNFVITFQKGDTDCLAPVRERLKKGRGRIRSLGADFLTYSIIDAVVDAYFPVVDIFAEKLEVLDDKVSTGAPQSVIDDIHDVRANLTALRRLVQPLRDSLVMLMPDPHALVGNETQFYLRDCFGHTIQLTELLDTYRETCSNLRDYYMTSINNRTNEIMKTLTVVATIFIPLSFIASLYGMNFNTNLPGNMPELNWPYGYLAVVMLMGLVGTGQLLFIWRKGWLGT